MPELGLEKTIKKTQVPDLSQVLKNREKKDVNGTREVYLPSGDAKSVLKVRELPQVSPDNWDEEVKPGLLILLKQQSKIQEIFGKETYFKPSLSTAKQDGSVYMLFREKYRPDLYPSHEHDNIYNVCCFGYLNIHEEGIDLNSEKIIKAGFGYEKITPDELISLIPYHEDKKDGLREFLGLIKDEKFKLQLEEFLSKIKKYTSELDLLPDLIGDDNLIVAKQANEYQFILNNSAAKWGYSYSEYLEYLKDLVDNDELYDTDESPICNFLAIVSWVNLLAQFAGVKPVYPMTEEFSEQGLDKIFENINSYYTEEDNEVVESV